MDGSCRKAVAKPVQVVLDSFRGAIGTRDVSIPLPWLERLAWS